MVALVRSRSSRPSIRLAGSCLLLGLLWTGGAGAAEAQKVGWLEPVVFPEAGLRVVAKLDTGAKTSSLDAEDVTTFEKDGEQWVRFGLRRKRGDGEARMFEARLVGTRKVRGALGQNARPLVDLWLCIAGERRRVLFTLSERRHMNYRVILGRRALEGRLMVDSGRKFTSDPGCPASEPTGAAR
jgi:hypothetical protein